MRPSRHYARRPRLLAAAGLTVAIAAAAPSGVLAAALKTTGFVGETAGGFAAITVSRDGRQVTRAFVAYTQKCSDNAVFTDWDKFATIPISARGAFKSSYDTGPQMSTVTPGATVEFAGQVTGRLNRKHTQVSGTSRFVYALKKADGTTTTCDTGTVSYIAKD